MKSGETGKAVSEKIPFRDYTLLYMYAAQGARADNPRVTKFLFVTKTFYCLNHAL